MGIISACISLVGVLLVFEKNSYLDDLDTNENSETIQILADDENSKPILTLYEALKTKNLWLLAAIYSFNCIPVDIFSINYKVNLSKLFQIV